MLSLSKKVIETVIKLAKEAGTADKLKEDTHFGALLDGGRWRDEVNLDPGASREIIQLIHDACKQVEDRSTQIQASQILRAMDNPTEAKMSQMRAFPDALVVFLKEGLIDGWMYKAQSDESFMPYLFETARYHPARNDDEKPYVTVRFTFTGFASDEKGHSVTLHSEDILGLSVPEIMARNGLYHETKEFKDAFLASLAKYEEYLPQLYKQFIFSGQGVTAGSHRWDRKTIFGDKTKVILDKPDSESRGRTRGVTLTSHSVLFGGNRRESEGNARVPFWPYLYAFDLAEHEFIWILASRLEPYQYKPELRDKLILPANHRDLVDVLTSSSDVLAEDIIEGKKGGTIVMCRGKPGLGKTLTAEVYSEVMKKPLYRVHSGQLGTDAESVEGNLKKILDRASRWDAICLIDEADVFVRQRGDDIDQNALTAVFLRVLEYWDGLLFMTTNRSDDIDDAIMSRCMAVVTYKMPGPVEREALWTVLSKQFEVDLGPGIIGELVEAFPEVSGRDIKNLLRLTKRFAEHRARSMTYTVEMFRQCAQFRGL